jgi:hypothetical protein
MDDDSSNTHPASFWLGKHLSTTSSATTFTLSDLPPRHRFLEPPDYIATADYDPERLNLFLDETETVVDVNFG